MKIRQTSCASGIALIIVMVVIFMMSILAGGFAFSMKVEMRLAQNHNAEPEMAWLGRSGVELARYVLAQQLLVANEPYDGLNQKWAGGTGVTNESLADISLENNELGSGSFSVKIIDMERKFNINAAASDPIILKQAMNLVGMDAADSSAIVDSIMDWRDTDDDPHVSGKESDYYLSLNPPYVAKNGPIDDITELLLIYGVTPEMFWGPGGIDRSASASLPRSSLPPRQQLGFQTPSQNETVVGLIDLFTPISGRMVNVNTASAAVLQLLPGIDANVAHEIVRARSGPDSTEGNEDDTPFRNVGELINVPGMNRGAVGQLARYFTVRSGTFEVTVTARVGNYQREYIALIRRNNARDLQTLFFYWK